MSVFRKFKLPQLLRKGPPGSEIGEDIPRFKCSELPVKQRIGQGSFGDVYTTEYKGSGDTKCHTVVIKKMLQVLIQDLLPLGKRSANCVAHAKQDKTVIRRTCYFTVHFRHAMLGQQREQLA
jgi:hypothetical protein